MELTTPSGRSSFAQHRPLLDVHLDKAQVVRRVAPQPGDVVHAQACLPHGLAHRHAVVVLLLQPFGLEVADERARAQEGGLVALAFLFGEGHQFDAEGQAAARAVQLAHTGHGHEDAQPPVVLAAVAHCVVVRSGQEGAGLRRGRVVAAHHVAHGVHLHLVEAAFAHPLADRLRAGAVGLGEVGDGELPLLGIAGVGVLGQPFVPVPHIAADQWLGFELVVQPDLGDAVDVAQRLGALDVGVVVQAAREGVDDLRLVEPRAARPAHGQDEGKAKARVVVPVELLQPRELLGRAVREACRALLLRGFGREALRHHGLARQFGVGADQRQLRLGAGLAHGLRHGVLEVRERAKGPLAQRGLGDPGRVFVDAVQQLQRLVGMRGVELSDAQGH
jgi:hypothetical protein